MKTKNYVFLLLLLPCVFASCDDTQLDKNPCFLLETVFINNDERLLNYDAVNDSEREPYFIEEFDDNNSQFPYQIGTDTDVEVSITDGKMAITYLVDSGYFYWEPIPIEIDENRNFEMETSMIIHSDSLRQTFACLPNQSGIKNIYSIDYGLFEDSNNKKIEYVSLSNFTNEWYTINGYDFNAKDFLNSNKFTVLTIRKIGNKYAIFINHKLFYIINDKNFIYVPAITMDEAVINVFDYFRVYYLP